MKVTFSRHAQQRFVQRAHMEIGAGYSYVRKAIVTEINPEHKKYIEKYQVKNMSSDPTLTVIAYKHLMFVVRIKDDSVFVVTVLVIH